MSLFSVNDVTLLGNVTKEPEVRYTNNGTSVVTLGVATNRSIKTDNGYDEQATFHNVKVWGKLGENVANQAKKGDPIFVSGRIDNYSYDGKDGNKRYISEVVAEKVVVFDRKDKRLNVEPSQVNEAEQIFNTKADEQGDLPF